MANILVVGTATNGPTNTVFKATNLSELRRLYGAEHTQLISLSATATSAVLDYTPQSNVRNYTSTKTGVLYKPSNTDDNLFFGSVGGTGLSVSLEYTPYLGKSDLINTASFLFENNKSDFYVCRIGGTQANFTNGSWEFCSALKGKAYNGITVSTLATTGGNSLEFQKFGQYGSKKYIGQPEEIVDSVNQDADLGIIPFYISNYTTTLPSLTFSLTGGLDGQFDYPSFVEFINTVDIPGDVSHVVFLGNLDDNINTYLVNTLSSDFAQYRVFCFQGPKLEGATSFIGGTFAESSFDGFGATPPVEEFDASTHLAALTPTLSCDFTGSPRTIDNTRVGFTSILTHSGTGCVQLFPGGSLGTISITPAVTGQKIVSVGMWIGKGTDRLRLSAYDGEELLLITDSLSGVGSGTNHFFGAHFNKPATKVNLIGLESTDPSKLSIDDLRIKTISSAGSNNNIDNILSSIRNLKLRQPYVCVFLGEILISVGGAEYRVDAINAVPLTLLENDGQLTNVKTKIQGLLPNYTSSEINFAYSNGFNMYRRWIGSGVAIDRGVALDYTVEYTYTNKVAEICRVSAIFLRKFIGTNLKRGYQQLIAAELKTKLLAIRDVVIEDVVIEYSDSLMTVYVEGYAYSQLLDISFNVRAT